MLISDSFPSFLPTVLNKVVSPDLQFLYFLYYFLYFLYLGGQILSRGCT